MKRKKIGQIIGSVSIMFLLIFGILVFIFSLLSGSEDYGGGLTGIIKNSPNSFPWLLLLVLVYIAWKSKLIGGILLSLFGIGMLYFFGIPGHSFQATTLIIGSLPVAFGLLLILSWGLEHEKNT